MPTTPIFHDDTNSPTGRPTPHEDHVPHKTHTSVSQPIPLCLQDLEWNNQVLKLCAQVLFHHVHTVSVCLRLPCSILDWVLTVLLFVVMGCRVIVSLRILLVTRKFMLVPAILLMASSSAGPDCDGLGI